MPALASDLRRQLESVIIQARDVAEGAARSALQKRAVDVAEPFSHFGPKERQLRNRLRARGRQAGDQRNADKTQTIDQLTQELAYEYWHRMLFARFLAENQLLMHPDGVAVSLEECEELAPSSVPPASNGYVLAARYASTMLPQIFRTDDVLLNVDFAPEQRLALEKLLTGLSRETFVADDSLGWVYQFWQSKRKDEVNKSGSKIDSTTISSVTQLFTEDYMVQFLLHNTLGAWWWGRVCGDRPSGLSESGQADQQVGHHRGTGRPEGLPPLEYLRFRDDGSPAAGKFEGWPKSLKEFKLLDPCCGSGHFLVAAFNLLVPLRMHDEKLSALDACDAVLRENLFGLELDPRCTQIAAFALAVAAWKYPSGDRPSGLSESPDGQTRRSATTWETGRPEGLPPQPLGYRKLPPLNIACTGIGPQATEEEWVKFADHAPSRYGRLGQEAIRNGLENLHRLFSQAPTLGSLINPNELRGDVVSADFETLAPLFAKALAEEKDDDAHERAVAAAGMVKAAELLAGEYTLVITNVPYLGRGKQDEKLQKHLEQHYPSSKADLATAFVERCLGFCAIDGATALVTPQNWLFLTSYKKLREELLSRRQFNLIARLGPRAFETITGEVVSVALLSLNAKLPTNKSLIAGINVAECKSTFAKANRLSNRDPGPVKLIRQSDQLRNPDARINIDVSDDSKLLSDLAHSSHGIGTFDSLRFCRNWWEVDTDGKTWVFQQSTPDKTTLHGGCSFAVRWENGTGSLAALMADKEAQGYTSGKWRAGVSEWGKSGVLVGQMSEMPCTLYTGYAFDENASVIIPENTEDLASIWCFCASDSFVTSIRAIDDSIKVTCGSLVKIPFDLSHWKKEAFENYPAGLPEPESDDPTQWLFHGRPDSSTSPLQVAVARLLGYRWPAELEAVGQTFRSDNQVPDASQLLQGGKAGQTGRSATTVPGTEPMRLSQRARELVASCEALLPLADRDGIVPIVSTRGEPPAAERVLEVLHAAYGDSWSDSVLHKLLADAGAKPGTTLDDWLAHQFFEQHCKLFHNRPFIWHIWDGRKDGFSCLVNYHRLNHKTLENLTYSYLQDWITAQTAQAKAGKTGADLRLAAAQALQEKLKLILAGESPYDIFVRWKPLHEQAIGWHPDLNDGVRMNIRPFIEAGILRKNPNIKWTKDRGKEPQRDKQDFPWFWKGNDFIGDRVNDVHLTNEQKTGATGKITAGRKTS